MRPAHREFRDDHQKSPATAADRDSFFFIPPSIFRRIRGIDFNFGKEPANSFTSDQHPDLRADFVMATAKSASATSRRSLAAEPAEKQDNPMPFNISEWWDAKLEGDARWRYGTQPMGNAHFAWIQHMLYHLAPRGSMAVDFVCRRSAPALLANASMSSGSGRKGEIRRGLIDADLGKA